jgi:hypothetical protein
MNTNLLPRVTEVLSDMIYEEYLMKWANSLGFKRQRYDVVRDRAACIGSLVHGMIEDKLNSNQGEYDIPDDQYQEVVYGYQSFILWWNNLNKFHTVRIISSEEHFETDKYQGTCDIILEIDGKIYIGDFKTSNSLSYRYILQVAGYIQGLKETKGIQPDGCFILQLDKHSQKYNMNVYSFTNIDHQYLFKKATETFNILLEGFSLKQLIKSEYKKVKYYERFI